MKIKVDIIEVERYPDYELDVVEHYGIFTVEVEKETLNRWDAAINQYNEVQKEIEEVYKSREMELWEKRTQEKIAELRK